MECVDTVCYGGWEQEAWRSWREGCVARCCCWHPAVQRSWLPRGTVPHADQLWVLQ